jgi:hypothetical protein
VNEEADWIYHVLDGGGDDHKMPAPDPIVDFNNGGSICGVGI